MEADRRHDTPLITWRTRKAGGIIQFEFEPGEPGGLMSGGRIRLDSTIQRREKEWFPWWLSGKESTCQRRRYRLHRWSQKIGQTAEEISLCTPTAEVCAPEPGLQETNHGQEKPAHRK